MFIFSLMLIWIFFLFIILFSKKIIWLKEKNMVFECGFNPLFKARSAFSLRFFKLSLIFLMFDIEIVMILPIPPSLLNNYSTYTVIFITMLIILLGLLIEWFQGSLNWIK